MVATACLAFALLAALAMARPAAAEIQGGVAETLGTTINYPVPGSPLNVAVEAPGHIWYTAPDQDGIGALVVRDTLPPSAYNYLVNFLVVPGSEPFDIAYTPDTIWFTARESNQLGRIDLVSDTLSITAPTKLYNLPTLDSGPAGLTIAADGSIWLTEQRAGKIARFDPFEQSFTEIPFPPNLFCSGNPQVCVENPQPFDIAVQGTTVWFTVPNANSAVSFSTITGQFFRVFVQAGSQPAAIVVDQAERSWVTGYAGNFVARYAPFTLALWAFYTPPTVDSGPKGLVYRAVGKTNELWFTQQKASKVGRLTSRIVGQTPVIVEFQLPPQSQPSGLALDENVHVWIAARGRNSLIELRPPYYANFFPAISLGP